MFNSYKLLALYKYSSKRQGILCNSPRVTSVDLDNSALLSGTCAHVWYVLPEDIRDPELLGNYRGLLTRDELARYQRFFFDRDRHLFLVAWALVRTTLSRYADVDPRDWTFATNRHGRPEITGPGAIPPLRFNLSHTPGLIACIVAVERDVGVDVENTRRRTTGPDIARRFFANAEVEALELLPEDRQQEAFFEYWTLKEAYIKAVGVGISLGLGRFSFALDTGAGVRGVTGRLPPTISFTGDLDDDPTAWQFAQYEPTPSHAMAAAIRRGADADLAINVRPVVPRVESTAAGPVGPTTDDQPGTSS